MLGAHSSVSRVVENLFGFGKKQLSEKVSSFDVPRDGEARTVKREQGRLSTPRVQGHIFRSNQERHREEGRVPMSGRFAARIAGIRSRRGSIDAAGDAASAAALAVRVRPRVAALSAPQGHANAPRAADVEINNVRGHVWIQRGAGIQRLV